MEMTDNLQQHPELVRIQKQVDQSIRRLLSEQNRDPYAPAYGCFDRRYWSWKLIDFPEATFQRNVYPLAWRLLHPENNPTGEQELLKKSITAGLCYAFQIQHRDGSFDQAFPNERSFGATAFLLHPLLESYKAVKNDLTNREQSFIEDGLSRAAQFLCTKSETHGLISNHLAGAALSLLLAGSFFDEERFRTNGLKILNTILDGQHSEGWFQEYDGADPGYQTLGLYYLAQAYRIFPEPRFKTALGRAVEFLSWFVHPDGSFAGEYGSRRTAVYYPGGIALLANEFPIAAAMTRRMLDSISKGHTVTLLDIDIGNLAPLLQSTLLALDSVKSISPANMDALPCDRTTAVRDFQAAGISVHSTRNYFVVVGTTNGGVIKVFKKKEEKLVYDDGGYVGILENGKYISTQMTTPERRVEFDADSITIEALFFEMLRSLPTPGRFVLLRGMNLTLMSSIWFGNLLKDLLVNLLIQGKKRYPLQLERKITFLEDSIEISDSFLLKRPLKLKYLACGIPFTSIHMASSRYFQGQFSADVISPEPIDIDLLQKDGKITRRIVI